METVQHTDPAAAAMPFMGAPGFAATSTSQSLVRRSPYDSIREVRGYLDDLDAVANSLCKATVLPKEMQNPANLKLVLMQGLAMGFDIIQSIRASFIIPPKKDDEVPKVGYYVDALVALVRQSGVCRFFRVEVTDAERCRVVCARKDEPEDMIHVFELTMEMAEKSGLDKKWFKERGQWVCEVKYNWKANPADMLNARTCGRACKRVFQDVVYGMTTPEDLEDRAHADHLNEVMGGGGSRPEFVAAPPRDAKPANAAPASSPPPGSAGAASPATEPTTQRDDEPTEGTGDQAWDELVVAVAKLLKVDAGDVLFPDAMRAAWDEAIGATKDRRELNAYAPAISAASKLTAKSKACAEFAAHASKSFNERNASLRGRKAGGAS